MTSSQTAESTTISTTLRRERHRGEHVGGRLGVDAGAGDEVAGALRGGATAPAGRRARSITSAVSDSATRHVVRPAHVRRTTTPTARTTPTDDQRPRIGDDRAGGDVPSSNRGTITLSMIQPHDDAENTVHDGEHGGAADGDEEQPLVVRAAARGPAGTPGSAVACVRRNDRAVTPPRRRPGLPRALRRLPGDRRCAESASAGSSRSVATRGASSTSALLVLRVVFGLFLAYHGYNKVFGGGGLAGTGRLVRQHRHALAAVAGPPRRRHRDRRRRAVRRSACSPRSPRPG